MTIAPGGGSPARLANWVRPYLPAPSRKLCTGNGGSKLCAAPASVPTVSTPRPTIGACSARGRGPSTAGPGGAPPLRNASWSCARASQPVRRNSQPPSGSGPCSSSQARRSSSVSRWWGSSAASADLSITAHGATSLAAGTLATSSPSRPVTQWIGASKCVPTCSPTVSVLQAHAGPRSSYSLIVSRESPGVLANGGGSCSTGVVSLSGCVRSTTRTSPRASSAARFVRVSVATKCLLQPFGTDVGIDFGVQYERAVAVLEPGADALEIVRRADGHAVAADGFGERGEVGGRELRELDRNAHRAEMVHLGAVGGVVVDHDEHVGLQPADGLEVGERHQQAAVADRGDRQAIRLRDRRPDRGPEPEADALEGLREHE